MHGLEFALDKIGAVITIVNFETTKDYVLLSVAPPNQMSVTELQLLKDYGLSVIDINTYGLVCLIDHEVIDHE